MIVKRQTLREGVREGASFSEGTRRFTAKAAFPTVRRLLLYAHHFFELFSARQVAGQQMRKSVFSHFGHSKGVVTYARACGPDELRGDPGGPGGEAQWPDGGSTACTERASETPAWVKG